MANENAEKEVTITQSIEGEEEELAAMIADAEALNAQVRAAFRARFDLEQKPVIPGALGNPAYDGSRRSFFLNWANHDIGATLSYLKQALATTAEQRRHWYAARTTESDGE